MSCFVVVVVVVLFSFLFIFFSSFSPMLLLLFLRLILLAWESSFTPGVFLSLSFQTHILMNLPVVVFCCCFVVVVVVVFCVCVGFFFLSATRIYSLIFLIKKKYICFCCCCCSWVCLFVVVVFFFFFLGGVQLSAYLSIFYLCITWDFCRKRRLESPCDWYCWSNPGRTLLDPAMAQSVKHTARFSLRFLHFILFISFNLFTAKELVLLGQVLWLFRQTSTSILGLAWFQFRVVLFLSGICF